MSRTHSLPCADNIQRTVLPNQITVLTRENFHSQSISLVGIIPGGLMRDSAERPGLSNLCFSTMMRGTASQTINEIFEKLEGIGARLSINGSLHGAVVSAQMLAEDLPIVLQTMRDVLENPAFPEDQVAIVKNQILASLAMQAHETDEMAMKRFREKTFGTHPYARQHAGTPELVAAYTREELAVHHQQIIGPQGMILSIAGGISAQESLQKTAEFLGDWAAAPTFKPETMDYPLINPSVQAAYSHVEIAEKSQLDLVVGSSCSTVFAPDHYPIAVGNCILGQFGMMGRIGEKVRDEHGLAYYAGSQYTPLRFGGSWLVNAGVNPYNVKQAIALIQQEIYRFATSPVTEEELSDAKSFMTGQMPLLVETNQGIASMLATMEWYQYGLDYLVNYPQMIHAVTTEQIMEAAGKYLAPERQVITTAGTLESKA